MASLSSWFRIILFLITLANISESRVSEWVYLDPMSNIVCDGRPLRANRLCNGILDCSDGSDENNFTICAIRPRACTVDEFTCANRRCVPQANLCNKVNDCGDDSDERGCNPSGRCTDEVCEYKCLENVGESSSYFCYCSSGFQIGADSRSCEDIDECSTFNIHQCPQLCENSNGSFSCKCKTGYVWSEYRCLATGPPLVLFAAVRRGLLSLVKNEFRFVISEYPSSSQPPQLPHGNSGPVDFDPVEKEVYWISSGAILKRSLVPGVSSLAPNIGKGQFLTQSKHTVNSIILDWVSRNIYWAESLSSQAEKGHIAVTTLDGRYKLILMEENIHKPYSIAVDPEIGLMVWSDTGCFPRIETSWMDGTHRQVIVHTEISRPSGVTIDYQMYHRVFWCDTDLNKIESINIDGTDRTIVISGAQLGHPVNVDVFGLTLYWSANSMKKLLRQDKFGRGIQVSVTEHKAALKHFKVFHPLKYPSKVTNHCSSMGCSHLCLVNPKGATCLCPEGDFFHRFTKKSCNSTIEEPRPNLPRCSCSVNERCQINPVSLDLVCVSRN